MAAVDNMSFFDSYDEAVLPSNKSRKRKKDVDKWKKNIKKSNLYRSHGKSPKIGCLHGGRERQRGCVCNVSQLSMDDMESFFSAFHSDCSKKSQDAFLLQHLFVTNVKRSQKEKQPKKGCTVQYYVSGLLC